MSAVEEYREAREGSFYKVTALTITMKADAAIAELEATCDELRESNQTNINAATYWAARAVTP